MNWSDEEYEEYLKNHKKKSDISLEKKKSKYGNKKVHKDGFVFDSQKEADRYDELCYMLIGGEILGFCVHPEFSIGGGRIYEADFLVIYVDHTEIEDVKGDWSGALTPEFKLKRSFFNEKYPQLEIKIIK